MKPLLSQATTRLNRRVGTSRNAPKKTVEGDGNEDECSILEQLALGLWNGIGTNFELKEAIFYFLCSLLLFEYFYSLLNWRNFSFLQ